MDCRIKTAESREKEGLIEMTKLPPKGTPVIKDKPKSEMQRTLVLIKADGVQRQIAGKILARFEDVGLKIVGMKMRWVDEKFASRHYFDVTERHGEKVFKDLLKYLTEGPVISMVLEGIDAVEQAQVILMKKKKVLRWDGGS